MSASVRHALLALRTSERHCSRLLWIPSPNHTNIIKPVELFAYIVMVGGAYLAVLTKQPAVVYGWFILYVAYSLIVRLTPQVIPDIRTYYEVVATWPPPLAFFTLREPVTWLGIPFLHRLIGSRLVTFLIIDVLSGMIVIHAMKTLDDDGDHRMLALAPTIITSYVFLLGQQNVLRQQVAFVILIWALAARSRHQGRALALFVLSVLAHNATAVLSGYWFDVGRRGRQRRYGPLMTVVGVGLIGILLPFLRKSWAATGANTAYLYVVLAGALGLLLLYASMGQRPAVGAGALANFIAFAPAVGILSSAQFERIAMMFLVLIVLDLYRHHRSLHLGANEIAHLA